MSIIPSFPYTLTNGTTADATQVMADFLQIQTDVNANAAPLANPTFTGIPAAPTATSGTNTTQLATTAFVTAALAALSTTYAPIASPTFTGTVTASTLTVTGNAQVGGTFAAGGLVSLSGGLNMAGSQIILGSLSVAGVATLTGGAAVGGTLSVAGVTTLTGGATTVTQASTDKSTNVATTAQVASQPGVAKAWANFNGPAGAINQGFNFASVVHNTTGTYTLTFSSALPDANYAVVATSNGAATVASVGSKSSSGFVVYSSGPSSLVDLNEIDVVVFR